MSSYKMIKDEEIYELREKRLSYKNIAEYFTAQGRRVSEETIRKRCKKIYELKKKTEPTTNKRNEVADEIIYEQREKGLSYGDIAEVLAKQGIKMSEGTVRVKSLSLYELKGDKDPKSNERRLIIDEKIYELREKGLKYSQITEILINEGTEINLHTVRERCKMMYRAKRKKEHKKPYGPRVKNEITDEEIYEEREKGLTYKEIAEKFSEEGRKIGLDTVRLRCKNIYKFKKQNEPRTYIKSTNSDEDILEIISKEELLEQILKLGKTKGANREQLGYIASLYGINLEDNKEVIDGESER